MVEQRLRPAVGAVDAGLADADHDVVLARPLARALPADRAGGTAHPPDDERPAVEPLAQPLLVGPACRPAGSSGGEHEVVVAGQAGHPDAREVEIARSSRRAAAPRRRTLRPSPRAGPSRRRGRRPLGGRRAGRCRGGRSRGVTAGRRRGRPRRGCSSASITPQRTIAAWPSGVSIGSTVTRSPARSSASGRPRVRTTLCRLGSSRTSSKTARSPGSSRPDGRHREGPPVREARRLPVEPPQAVALGRPQRDLPASVVGQRGGVRLVQHRG